MIVGTIVSVILLALTAPANLAQSSRAAGTVSVVLAIDTETRDFRSSVHFQRLNLSDYYGDGQVCRALSDSFRLSFTDSYGGHPKFTWFCLTHQAYWDSDQKDGAAVWVATRHLLGPILAQGDMRGWHFHSDDWCVTDGVTGEGCWKQLTTFDGTKYNHGTDIEMAEQMMAMVIGKLGVYPVVYRSGWNWENADLSRWLDDVVPFDFSNAAPMSSDSGHISSDPAGNLYDWSRAPSNWNWYRPDTLDYQRPGSLKRTIFRCLPGYRVSDLDFARAFRRAANGENVMVAAYAHSFDDLAKFCRVVQGGLRDMSAAFPNVRYRYVTALEGAQATLGLTDFEPPRLEVSQEELGVMVTSDEPLFSFPFGSYQDADGQYHRARPVKEAPDTSYGGYSWVFDLSGAAAQTFSVGACDRSGNATVMHLGSAFVKRSKQADSLSRRPPDSSRLY